MALANDIIGQDAALDALTRFIADDRAAHASHLLGARGEGKCGVGW